VVFYVMALCSTALSWGSLGSDRFETCVDVGVAAHEGGVDIATAVALSYTESRFNRAAVSHRGAHGALQVIPVFHCNSGLPGDCDLIVAGIGAIVRYQARYGREWLCHWNSGNRCYRRSHVFARLVRQRIRRLRR
jgi:hypothetical protein